jgi:hypothetical protein
MSSPTSSSAGGPRSEGLAPRITSRPRADREAGRGLAFEREFGAFGNPEHGTPDPTERAEDRPIGRALVSLAARVTDDHDRVVREIRLFEYLFECRGRSAPRAEREHARDGPVVHAGSTSP